MSNKSVKIPKLEKERGKALKTIILELWDKHGTQQALADELGVSQGTVSLWMLRLGLSFKTIIIDERETA